MGGSSSVSASPESGINALPEELTASHPSKVSFDQLLAFVTPVYYNPQPLLPFEKEIATKNWKDIINCRAAEFWRIKKADPTIPCKSPPQYFGNQFFLRLLEVHPTSKGLFTGGTMSRGETFVKMVSFIIDKLDNEERLAKTLETLINSHCRMGVRAVEYGVLGEVLFSTLKKVLGEEYTPIAHGAWVKVYSKLLTIMLPKVIMIEFNCRPQMDRISQERNEVVLGKKQGHEGQEDLRPGCPV
eukprot:gene7186-7953_t